MKADTRQLGPVNLTQAGGFPKRVADFSRRALWMLRLTGNPWQTYATIRQIRRYPNKIQTVRSGSFSISFRGTDELALYEVLVLQEYNFLRPLLEARDRPKVLDIGAHIGTFALWTFAVNSQAQVLSVEADPDTCQITLQNSQQLTPQGFHWQTLEKAAGATDDEFLSFSSVGPSMSHRLNAEGDIAVHSISLRSLLNFLDPQHEGVDLMKIDIEGGEENFLCNNPDALDQVKSVVVELHPELCNVKKVLKILKSKYSNIQSVNNRLSSKPLLYCHH
ncbi:MAG: FkbM family methyltransferase [Leptolyngbyaceae cyanobacterium]